MVCAVGIGVPRVKTVMYALFFCINSCCTKSNMRCRDYQNEQAVRELIENCSLPEGYDLLYNMKTQRAEEEYLFMRYCIMRPRCYIFYTYVWKNDKWYFRRLDGSGDIPFTDAIKQRIED